MKKYKMQIAWWWKV